ncbi:hypothetical protein K501DRAFT_335303 [Backusella circina FSU 941]|nr:hypothetical protein K501DRAFT_335303 [Backusella circina FSU 941]
MDSFASFFGLKKSTSSKTSRSSSSATKQHRPVTNTIVVAWNERYYDVHFNDVPGGMSQVTVAQLKEHCKRITGVTLATMKLKVSGAYIKDDTATLPSSGIHSGSLVFVLGDAPSFEQAKQTASGNPEEVGFLIRISKAMDKIEGSKEPIEQLEILVVSVMEHNEENRKEAEDLGTSLSETLMQALITLDGVDCPPDFQTARLKRKEAVKMCQELMDRVDQVKTILKQSLLDKQKL